MAGELAHEALPIRLGNRPRRPHQDRRPCTAS